MTRMTWKITASTIALAVGCGASGAAFANEDVMAQVAAGNVVMPSITYNGWNISMFDQIDRGNVDQLQLQWAFQLGALDEYEAPPLVVGNVMYIVHPVDAPEEVPNFVTAHDLTDNGRILWEFRPDIPDVEAARQACCGDQTRGMQYAEGKIFMHTLDGQVFALDAETGEPLWRTTGADASIREHTAGNGLIAGDLYIIGNAGGEYGVRGKVQAFNIDSGNLQWVMFSMGPNNEVGVGPRFDPQYEYMQGANPALDTWFGDSWRHGGGTAWGYFTFDPDRNMFFYGTGNCGPWNPDYRREWGVLDLDENGGLDTFQNNWCAASMARDATTGELIWAYANTPGDPWDLDVPLIHPLIEYEGQDAVVLAARNGWMYVWDRDNGRILNVPWMHTFVDITMGHNLETGLPIYVPDNWSFTDLEDRRRYTDADPMGGGRIDAEDYTGTEIEVCPGTSARNWQNDVYNPNLGLLYTVNNTSCSTWRFIEGEYEAGAGYTLLNFNAGPSPERWFGNGVEVGQTFYNYQDLVNAPVTEITNQLMANDPHNGVQVWTVDYFQGNDSPPFGTITDLIFKGGKHDGAFHAHDAATGEELWKFSLGTGFEGTAISYMGDDGRQYIAVIGSSSGTSNVDAGDGPNADERWRRGGSTLYVFALPTSVAGN